MAAELITINQTVFGFVVGIASSAFTAGATYAALVGRVKRNEERIEEVHADLERFKREEFVPFKQAREQLTEQWREQSRQYERAIVKLETRMDTLLETVSAIADRVGAVR